MALDLRSALTKLRAILAGLAPITPLKIDDACVVFIDAVLADAGLFGWFEDKAKAHVDGTLSLEGPLPVALQTKVEELRLDPAKVPEMISVLIQLLALLR